MAARPLASSAVAKCPQCGDQVSIPAARQQVVIPAAPSDAVNPSIPTGTVADSHVAAPNAAAPSSVQAPSTQASTNNDFGQLDLPPAPTGASPVRSPLAAKRQSSRGGFTAWVKGHPWIAAIIGLNLLTLACCVFFPPVLLLCAVQIPVGAVVIGLLLIPRQHIVQRVGQAFGSVGSHLANAGAGGVLLVILAVLAKAIPRIVSRSQRNENLDFSGFLDPSNVAGFVGSLVVFLAVAAVGVTLWRYLGLARLIATGYLAVLSFTTFILILGLVTNGQQDDPLEHRADIAALREETSRMSGPNVNGPRMPRPPNYPPPNYSRPNYPRPDVRPGDRPRYPLENEGPMETRGQRLRPMQSNEVRVIVMHKPDTDVASLRDRLLERAGHPKCQTREQGAITHLILEDSRSPQEIADLIDFGRVMHANRMTRSITVIVH